MIGRNFCSMAWTLALAVGSPNASLAQSVQPIPAPAPVWGDYFTVATMAPDGSWGVATELSAGEAIAGAIRRCRAMSRAELGCGAQFAAVWDGWIVAYRCGDRNMLAAGKVLADAQQAARERESELRTSYAPSLPPCRHVLTVDPGGEVAATRPRVGAHAFE